MTIVKRFFISFLLFFVSFSSHALYQLKGYHTSYRVSCVSSDSIINPSDLIGCELTTGGKPDKTVTESVYTRGYIEVANGYWGGLRLFKASPFTSCPPEQVYDPEIKKCVEKNKCADTVDTVFTGRQWDHKEYGSRPVFCAEQCEFLVDEAVCMESPSSSGAGMCTGDLRGSGNECPTDGMTPGGSFPEPDTGGGDGGDGGTGGGGDGGTGGGGDGGTGGGGDGGTGGGGDNSDVVAKLEELKIDSNNRLDTLDKSVTDLTVSTGKKLDELLASSNSMKGAIDSASEKADKNAASQLAAIQGVSDGIAGLGSSIEGVSDSIGDLNDSITNVDTSSLGTGRCWENDSCKSFYTPEYPDGLSGVLITHYDDIKNKFSSGVIDSFNSLDISNAAKPSYVINLNFGSFGNFGRYDIFEISNLSAIFLFVRTILLASTVLYARSLIFGG